MAAPAQTPHDDRACWERAYKKASHVVLIEDECVAAPTIPNTGIGRSA